MGAGYHTIHHTVYKHNYGELAQLLSTGLTSTLTIAICQQRTDSGPLGQRICSRCLQKYFGVLHICLPFCTGHYFIYMDKLFGSLVTPTEYAAAMAKPGSALKAA